LAAVSAPIVPSVQMSPLTFAELTGAGVSMVKLT
jgi:hypothetical protein